MSAVDFALLYARQFGPIWAQTPQQTGYRGTHGSHDATRDEATIRRLWSAHSEALPALMTGEASDIVALDIDTKNGRNGFDTLELLGVAVHPKTPTAHTPHGGAHLLFARPGAAVPSSQDRLGPGLEVKGDGAWITLPFGRPDRLWDPHLGVDTPIAPMPSWMVVTEPERPATSRPVEPADGLSHYARAALNAACHNIATAPAGEQERTLAAESFTIGQLAGADAIPCEFARRALVYAGERMTSFDPRRRWVAGEIAAKVARSFRNGLGQPRRAHG